MAMTMTHKIQLWVAGIAVAGMIVAAIITGLMNGIGGIGGDSVIQDGNGNDACVHSVCPKESK